MSALDNLQASVAHESEVSASVIALLGTIKADLDAAIAAGNDDPAIQAIADQINTNSQTMADAVVANTPAAPEPPAA